MDTTLHKKAAMTYRELFEKALRALETNNKAWKHLADSCDAGFWEAEEQPFYEMSAQAITALRQAIDQFKPLSDEEIALIVGECAASAHRHDDFSFARAIERAHGIGGGE